MRVILEAIHPEPEAVRFARLMNAALVRAGVIKREGK